MEPDNGKSMLVHAPFYPASSELGKCEEKNLQQSSQKQRFKMLWRSYLSGGTDERNVVSVLKGSSNASCTHGTKEGPGWEL